MDKSKYSIQARPKMTVAVL